VGREIHFVLFRFHVKDFVVVAHKPPLLSSAFPNFQAAAQRSRIADCGCRLVRRAYRSLNAMNVDRKEPTSNVIAPQWSASVRVDSVDAQASNWSFHCSNIDAHTVTLLLAVLIAISGCIPFAISDRHIRFAGAFKL